MIRINMYKTKCAILLVSTALSLCDASYESDRNALLRQESLLTLGGNLNITDEEFRVNNCLMQAKFNEIDLGFDSPQFFNFSKHFFEYKDAIKRSKVYNFIKAMPKGAALHIHDTGILGPDYLMNITYLDHLYVCLETDNVKFKFANQTPVAPCLSDWQLMSKARQASGNEEEFNKQIRRHFSMVINNPEQVYTDINKVWKVFANYFITVGDLLTYRPVWEQYFYDTLKAFRDENIFYVEVRSVLPNLYELDGSHHDALITAKSYKKTTIKFVKDYPDFIGAKLIYAPNRLVNQQTLNNYIYNARRIKQDMPEHFAGFDLVGQEDLGNPLIDYAPTLSKVKDIDFFFHAGETNWYGSLTDQNLLDAILLGTKRIGHGYALSKHPVLINEVVKRQIGLEVNIISNNVLKLVDDVRNHPVASFFAQNLPVVISSDDPGIWEADPISDDFYVAFVGVASKLSDLRLLKALALNSINYSALTKDEKTNALAIFENRWNDFISNFSCDSF